jgi:ADP-ribose pyrophosphatase
MKKFEETIQTNKVYQGRILNVYANLVNIEGEQGQREFIEHTGGVCICGLDSNNHVLVVEQYRYGAQKFLLELPAGKLGRGEDPNHCAQREFLEETGYKALSFDFIGHIYPTPAYNSERISCYLASDLEFVAQNLDEGEHLDVKKVPLSTLKTMVLNGEIEDAKSAYVILKVCAVKGI